MQRNAWLVISMLALAGCGSTEAPTELEEVEEAAEENDRESVFDPWVDTIDRAEGVQRTLDDAAAQRRRRLEEDED